MTFISKNADDPKYKIDMSRDKKKYKSRTDCLLNILFCSSELPNDLYRQMNISYECFRQNISRLLKRGLIQRISADGAAGYQLTLKGKRLVREPDYAKYRDYVEAGTDRHYSIKRRRRKRQQAYVFALLDRAGISYETFSKPGFEEAITGDKVYYYEAIEFKRLIGYESTVFQGSTVLGFFVGKNRIIPVYKANSVVSPFGKHETLVPEALMRHFRITVDTAIFLSSYVKGTLAQIIDGYNYHNERINTAGYRYFYVFATSDNFLSHFQDIYDDHSATERRLIERYNINTSDKDDKGRYRFVTGTGFIYDSPVYICAGNINTVKLRSFISNAERNNHMSIIFCKKRDHPVLEEITKDKPIKLVMIKSTDNHFA